VRELLIFGSFTAISSGYLGRIAGETEPDNVR